MSKPEGRGKTFKRGKIAPDALKEALKPVQATVKPIAVVAKEMFAAPRAKNVKKPVAAAAAPVAIPLMKPKVAAPAAAAPAALKPKLALPAPPRAPIVVQKEPIFEPPPMKLEEAIAPAAAPAPAAPAAAAAVAEDIPEEPLLADLLEAQEAAPTIKSDLDLLPEDQQEMAILIQNEEKRDLYDTQVPAAYVPQTRRGFADFIKLQYKPFILPSTPIVVPEGDKYYPYQKFVRDYMRKESPYRGIVVYHGLGSGKTCTAIAAAEALFATSKKNIIVMSPASLKKNFLREVSKCGFRHFQLKNFWVALPNPRDDPTVTLFATRVLGLSTKYLKSARNVWAPDFRKPQSESNYETLPPEDREEIRKQILSIVEYDPVSNPTGRIRFISYNGISAKKLVRMACDKSEQKFFDNSVIVVDEIHNLIRMIQGNIEPYLVKTKEGVAKGQRKIEVESVTPGRWTPNPVMCDEGRTTGFYKRGYLFYRLLVDARNSKIVGLSGTPLINFPEELGILSNVLHGYITVVEGVIGESGKVTQERAKEVGLAHPFTDFVGTKYDTAGTRVIMSLLPEGTRKIDNNTGVVRIPPFAETEIYTNMYSGIVDLFQSVPGRSPAIEEVVGVVRGEYVKTEFPPFDAVQRAIMGAFGKAAPTAKQIMDAVAAAYDGANSMEAILKSIQGSFAAAGIPFTAAPIARSEALLPAFGDDFSRTFVPNGTNLINKATLLTRLTGIVSYYKGSSLELMPRVKSDEVVRVPFSDYAQKAYTFKRTAELKREMEASPGQTVDAVWAQIYELGDSGASNNYKMGSRQACNFVFPPEVARPSPTAKEEKEEASDGVVANELVALAAEEEAVKGETEEFPELEEEALEAEAEEEVVPEEEEAAAAAEAEAEAEAEEEDAVGGGKTLAEIRAEKRDPATVAAAATVAKAAYAAECKSGNKRPGEKYPDACARARACLATVAKARMMVSGEDGLANYSAKFAAMLERIAAAPGSSLIYSQFLDMEGVGIFRVAMDVNGYAPIEIVMTGGTLSFTKATEVSLRKGPGKQPRYLTFSGKEKAEIRAAALSIFNAQFADLPESMNQILREAGYTDNKVGELCRVFCITSAGAEGLSLRNVRAVHIMEPYWNEVRLKQVKGRAIRIGSHLDLPPDQRDVSIYTYVSIFSDEAQSNRVPERRIDQTLLLHDSVDVKKATDAGIPVKAGQTTYVLTTDEMIYAISERKRKIIEALECIMKSSSVDCEVNIKKNKDGTFMCLPLKGKIGDFISNPVLADDILAAPQFQGADGKDILDSVCVPGAAPVEVAEDPAAKDIFKALKGVTYRMRPIFGEDGMTVERFDMYEADQARPMRKIPLKLLGMAGAKDGKPAPPVKML